MRCHVAQKIKCAKYSCKKLAKHVTQEYPQGHSKKQFKLSKKARMNLKSHFTAERPDKHYLSVNIHSDVIVTVCTFDMMG